MGGESAVVVGSCDALGGGWMQPWPGPGAVGILSPRNRLKLFPSK